MKMSKSRQFLLICNFALILCNLVCSMAPRLSPSTQKTIAFVDLTESTDIISEDTSNHLKPAATRKYLSLDTGIDESKKRISSVMSDLDKSLALDDHEAGTSNQPNQVAEMKYPYVDIWKEGSRKKQRVELPDINELPVDGREENFNEPSAHSTFRQSNQGHTGNMAESSSTRAQKYYDPEYVQDLSGQSEAEQILELKNMLFDWDKKQQEFVNKLSQSPPGLLANEPETLQQESRENTQGLVSKRIQDKEHMSILVAKENEAEVARLNAFAAARSGNIKKLKEYLQVQDVLEFHLKDLIPSLPLGPPILMMKINQKLVFQLICEALNKANKRRQKLKEMVVDILRSGERMQTSRISDHSPLHGHKSYHLIEEYFRREFEDYSRLLLSILVQASREFHWDLSDISAPITWFSSIFYDESCVLGDRIFALKKLQLGDIEMAETYFWRATKTQSAINDLQKKLHSMGLTGWTSENNSQYCELQNKLGGISHYLRLKSILNQEKTQWSLPSTENDESELEKLTHKRIKFERNVKLKSEGDQIEDSSLPSTDGYNSFSESELMRIKILVCAYLECFGNELKARLETLLRHPYKAHKYLLEALSHQKIIEEQAESLKEIFNIDNTLYLDYNQLQEYAHLKDSEIKVLQREATRV